MYISSLIIKMEQNRLGSTRERTREEVRPCDTRDTMTKAELCSPCNEK